MPYKIAIASSDGQNANQHFAKADTFYIIEVYETKEYKISEIRKITPVYVNNGHNIAGIESTIQLLSDCKYVLVSQIGMFAEKELTKKGITVFSVELDINIAVEKIINYISISKKNSSVDKRF